MGVVLHRTGKSSAGIQQARSTAAASASTFTTGSVVLKSLAASLAVVLASGCGASYRPVVSAINPVGPASQPTKFAIVISRPGTGSAGLMTAVDFSGDTIISTPSLLTDPSYFALGNSGSTAFVINTAGALSTFGVSNPAGLLTRDITQTSLLAGASPVSITTVTTPGAGSVIFIPEVGRSSVAALSASGPSLLTELAAPAGTTPNYVVGYDSAARAYSLSSSTGGGAGYASAIETSLTQPAISANLQVGINPVYGVMSSDLTRAYIVNKGSGTVSVINVQTNALDVTTPVIPATGTLGANPVWAELVPSLSELVVVNAGDGTTAGSLSIISVPLCNSVTPVTNPSCNAANPTDAIGFGTVIATVPVGVNPVMVSVLKDGSRAYVANAGNAAAGIEGSVSVVDLTSNRVSATIAGTSSDATTTDASTSPTKVYGHPNSIATALASPTGKVYITSGDNRFLTVLRTDTDAVTTHINLQGLGLRVLMTSN